MADDSARNNGDVGRAWVKCLLCAWSWKYRRTGRAARETGRPVAEVLGPVYLGQLDPDREAFIQFRDTSGGRGSGFPVVSHLTLAQAASDPLWRPLALQVVTWARRLVALGDRLGL